MTPGMVHYPSGRSVVMTDLGPLDELARVRTASPCFDVRVLCSGAKTSLVSDGRRTWWIESWRLTRTGVQRAAEAAVDRAAANHAALRAYRNGFDDTLRLTTRTGDAIELRRGDHPEPPSDTPWPT